MTIELDITQELDRLAVEFIDACAEGDGSLPSAPFDADWDSLAIVGRAPDDHIYWRPTRRTEPFSMSGMSTALEATFPDACEAYFGHFWSGSIPVIWGERPFELLQLWNAEDENNLMHNLLGHSLEKKRVREPLTVFFALIDDARFLSVDVASGAVLLEEVGGERPEEVATDLAALLSSVTAVASTAVDE
ncbi:MAG: SecY-interacting protein Syd [Gammaproteobacteria bacterium]